MMRAMAILGILGATTIPVAAFAGLQTVSAAADADSGHNPEAESNSASQQVADARTNLAPGLKIVCRRMPPPPGSRIGGRNICRTQADWNLYRREARDVVMRMQDLSHF